MFGLGAAELAVIVVVALVLLGPERLPTLARAMARGYREFSRVRRQVDATLDELKRDIDLDLDDPRGQAPRIRPAQGSQPRVPLDQLHAVEQPAPELDVPPEDDYLAAAVGAKPASPGGADTPIGHPDAGKGSHATDQGEAGFAATDRDA